MKTNYEIRYAAHPEDAKNYDTGRIRRDFLIETVFSADEVSFQNTPKVEVADTVGAGDSFTGSFIASILRGKTIPEAHKCAVEVSAFVCTQNGAMPVLPAELTE